MTALVITYEGHAREAIIALLDMLLQTVAALLFGALLMLWRNSMEGWAQVVVCLYMS